MNPHQLMHGTNPVITALYEMGRWDEIQPVLEQHLGAFSQDPAIECFFVRDGPVLGALVAAKSGDLTRARELAAMLPDPASHPDRASAMQASLAIALGDPSLGRAISAARAVAGRQNGPHFARTMLGALVALEDWTELERFLPHARRQVSGLAILGPTCDRAEALLRRHRYDESAGELLEQAENGFAALDAGAELAVTRALVRLPS
jgi:hypothetical protein